MNGLIDGSEMLAEGANAQAIIEHKNHLQKALMSIVMAVGTYTSQLYLITSAENPEDAWKALLHHFEQDTLANKLFLKKKYFQMEMKEATSLEAHIKHMK